MTFVLVGTGALGRTFGTLLAAAGHPVVLIGRASAADELGGLSTIQVHGAVEASAPVRTGRPEPGAVAIGRIGDELPRGAAVLFTTKAHQLAEAAKAVAPYWPSQDPAAWTAGVQNGLLTGELLTETFGAERVVGASTVVGARRTFDGAAVASVGMTYLGELDGSRSERVDAAAAAFRDAGLPCDGAQDIRGVLWAKACHAAAVFGLSALTGLPTGQIMTNGPLLHAYSALIREVASVAQAVGVAIGDYPDLPMRTNLELPASELVQRLSAGGAPRGGAPPPSFSSMAQDLAAGRPTEHDEIFGDLVRRATGLGVEVPRISLIRDVVAGIDPGA